MHMEDLIRFAVTLLIAVACGLLGKKLRLPAGLLVGSMVGVAAFHTLTGQGLFFPTVRTALQVFSGALVGARIGRAELRGMRMLLPSVVILLLSMVLLNLTFALLITLCSGLSPATALFATAPGGVNDMSIIASDFGADAGVVAILQVFRLILIYLFIPPTIRWLDGRDAKKHPAAKLSAAAPQTPVQNNPHGLLAMLLCAAAIGLLLHALGVSAGAMIGAMIGSAAYCILRGKQKYPATLKTALQLCSGAYIGCRIDRATILGFGDLLLPLLIMLLGILAFTFMTSSLMCRLSRLSRSTAMLASTPGGIQEMSLLSEELGADTPSVAVLHTTRIVFVILCFPYLIQLLLRLIPA